MYRALGSFRKLLLKANVICKSSLKRNSITCVIKLFSALLKICAILSKIESIFCKFHVKYPKLVTKEKKAKYLLSQECFLCMLQGPWNHKGTWGSNFLLRFWQEQKQKPCPSKGLGLLLAPKRISKRGSGLKLRSGCYNYRFNLHK